MSSSEKSRNRRILVVDDEADVLDVLKIYLESHEWEVTTADSSRQALEVLSECAFFLILTDVAMPEMDGYELVCEVRDRLVPSEIVLMTGFGYNPEHTLVKINKSTRYPVIFKPFEFKTPRLLETVQKAWDTYHDDLTD